jgi:hypothetical protein
MKTKKLWLGVLILVLAFGMTIIGCEEEPTTDTNPSPPTGLAGTAVSPTSVQLTWNAVSNASEYWIEYKKNSSTVFTDHKEGITSASYTVTNLVPETKYDFKVAVHNTDGYDSSYSTPITVETLSPSTGSVSLSYLRTESQQTGGSYYYTIGIFLKLSEGTYWTTPVANTVKAWVNVTGVTLTSWTFQVDYTESEKDLLRLWYKSPAQSSQISIPSGITASIDQTKLTEMLGYTNATTSITVGSPSSRSSSSWTQ